MLQPVPQVAPRARALRSSLLASLGLLHLACGGTVEGVPGGSGDVGGSANASGAANRAGAPTTTEGGSGGQSVVHPTPTRPKPTCTAPTPEASGNYVTCSEGYRYRAKSDRCQNVDTGRDEASLPRVSTYVDCSADPSVCSAFAYGACETSPPPGPGSGCVSLCGSDADCSDGGVCRCSGDGGPGHCTYGDTCETDADCGAGYHCASTSMGCGNTPFTCQSADDRCFSPADCSGSDVCSTETIIVGEQVVAGPRHCTGASICGRPFLVLAEPRLPTVVTRTDWLRDEKPAVAQLTLAERTALAEHFSWLGQMEHASIAAFARFQLQLLALGAPPELVEACNQALVDETAHARLCFGLASAYAGRTLGPGPLDVRYSLEAVSLVDVVDLVIAEGCYGETRAALEALEAADNAQDPVVKAAYARIAEDEHRHAELAFRFVRWALEREPEAVGQRILMALEAAPNGASAVAAPCLEALLASRRPHLRPRASAERSSQYPLT